MKSRSNPRRGQTILLFSMSTVVMFGMLGLVVDLGWGYFRKQAAQAAAQSAAIAAVAAAVEGAGTTAGCSSINVVCQAEAPCPTLSTNPVSNTDKGCLYATANGFSTSGRQKVTIASGIGIAPTGNGSSPQYWVTVRVTETIPQLFAAVLGFQNSTVAARSTA